MGTTAARIANFFATDAEAVLENKVNVKDE